MSFSDLFVVPSVSADFISIDPEFTNVIPASSFAQYDSHILFTCEYPGEFEIEQRKFRNMFEIRIESKNLVRGCAKPSSGTMHMIDGFVSQKTLWRLFDRRSWAAFGSVEHGLVDHKIHTAKTRRVDKLSSSIVIESTSDGTELFIAQTARAVRLPGDDEAVATIVSHSLAKSVEDLAEIVKIVESIEPTAWIDS